MQVLGFWRSLFWRKASANIGRFAVLAFLTIVASGHMADAAEANAKFAAVTVDARNGKLLYAENADAIRHPASLTKMMTLYILFQDLKSGKIKLNSPIRMSARAAAMAPSKLGVKAGNSITVETAIKALVVKSANDVAAAVAENLAGTERAFALRMTRTARSLGMSRTTFANASGLPNPAQVTTARDMATLGLRLMRDFPQYYPYFRTQHFTYKGKTIRGHNRLLGKYEGTDGIKTGYINASGFNLVSSVRRGNKRLVGVVLGGRTGASRDAYMKKMLTQNFPGATNGKTIVAYAGSSKGAIAAEPTQSQIAAAEADTPEDEIQTASAADATPPAAAPAQPAPVQKQAQKSRRKNVNPDKAVTQAPATEEGDTQEDGVQAPITNEADLQPQEAQPVPQVQDGSTIQQVQVDTSVETVPQPTIAQEQPKVIQAEVGQQSPAAQKQKLPFQVKTPSEQLADQATVASLPTAPVDGGWMISIGDYATKQDAQARIQDLRRKASDALAGKTAQTVVVEKSGKVTYRARFTGFDEGSAKSACKVIKKRKSVCQIQAPS